jgi:hypothetical protein
LDTGMTPDITGPAGHKYGHLIFSP